MPLSCLIRSLMICSHLLAPCFLSCLDSCKDDPSASSAPSFPPLYHCLLTDIFLDHPPRLSLVPFTCAYSAAELTTLNCNCPSAWLSPTGLGGTQRKKADCALDIPVSPVLCTIPGGGGFQVIKWFLTNTHTHTYIVLFDSFPLLKKSRVLKRKQFNTLVSWKVASFLVNPENHPWLTIRTSVCPTFVSQGICVILPCDTPRFYAASKVQSSLTS